MLLQALYDLYERFETDPDYDVAPFGRSFQKIAFIVVIDRNGDLIDIQDARQEREGRLQPQRVLVLGSTKPSGSGLNPCTLWDSAGYMLGWYSEKASDPAKAKKRAQETFKAFKEKHLALEKAVRIPEFSAVCRFLETWRPERCKDYPLLDELQSGFGVFQIRGETRYVHEHPAVSDWWDRQTAGEDQGPPGRCLVTGAEGVPIARIHPKIQGIFGAQPSGATIAGFNAPAYESYGWTQSFNAPVSEEAARRYTAATKALLDSPQSRKHRKVIGGTTVVFWTDRPCATEDIFLAFAAEGSTLVENEAAQDEAVRKKLQSFLQALRKGREAYSDLDDDPERTDYWIAGLAAPTPARIAVRFLHHGRLADLLENLRRHHRDISVERQYGKDRLRSEPEYPSLQLLLDQTCPWKNGKPDRAKIPPVLAGPLLEAVVTGARYPEGLYAAVMRRVVADRVIDYPRAAIIKGYWMRNLGKEVPVSLDRSRTEPAYRLGRLFAVLEKTQKDALGNTKSGIRSSFYASASATPRAVIPRLLRTYQHHLAKLEEGRKVHREKLVQEILDPLSEIPAHLNLADQGLFALGYYHQMNALFATKDRSDAPAGQTE